MDGAALRALRRRFKLTQRQVAEAAGMRQPDLSAIENDRRGSAEARARVLSAIRGLATPSLGLDADMRRQIRAVIERHGGTDIRIFGSVARGSDKPGSDLDLLARFPERFDLFDLMRLEQEVEDILGIAVDVIADSPRAAHALAQATSQAVSL